MKEGKEEEERKYRGRRRGLVFVEQSKYNNKTCFDNRHPWRHDGYYNVNINQQPPLEVVGYCNNKLIINHVMLQSDLSPPPPLHYGTNHLAPYPPLGIHLLLEGTNLQEQQNV